MAGWMTLLAIVVLLPVAATAEIGVDVEPIRSWPVPFGTSPYTAEVDSSIDGTTLLVLWRGLEENAECVVVVADSQRARAYSYRHDFYPTNCVDAVPHRDGGFFVRGERADQTSSQINGFTSRIDGDGDVLWTVTDDELMGRSPHPAGPGEFRGQYVGAIAGLAYHHDKDALLGLTLAETVLPGANRPLIQAFVMDGTTGELRVNGRGFGPMSDDLVVDVIAAEQDFLVAAVDRVSQAPRLYSYDGARSVTTVTPDALSGTSRYLVHPLAYHGDLGAFALWADGNQTNPRTGVLRLDEGAGQVWSREYEALGEPHRIWAGGELAAIRYLAEDGRDFVRFIDIEEGEDLGEMRWADLVDHDPIEMVRGPDGQLRILAIDPAHGRVWEYDFWVTDETDVEEPVGEEPEVDDEESGGCRNVSGNPVSGGLLFLIVVGWLLGRGSMSDCGPPPRPSPVPREGDVGEAGWLLGRGSMADCGPPPRPSPVPGEGDVGEAGVVGC